MQEPIIIEQKINAPIERVWRAISERNEMRHWYFDLTRFWPELDCDFQFNEIKGGKKYVVLCRITDIVEKRKLTYSWKYEGFRGTSTVTFRLTSSDKDTIVELTHQGTESFQDAGPAFTRDSFTRFWKRIIKQALKDYAEREKINHSVKINADPNFVWQALTGKEEMQQWMNAYKKGITIESDWKEGSDVLWRSPEGGLYAKGVVTVNNPGHYLKIYFPCYDEETCALNPGEDYQIYMITGISENQSMLEVECNTYSENTEILSLFWEQALKKIRQIAEKEARNALISQ